MKSLLLLLLAGCAVRCDDSNYYVIEMPEEDPPRISQKPFKVYWNVPTMQCKSKKIPFENLYDEYGIIQNREDSFRGEKIAILYDPGLFPALLKNETSGKFKFRNGGVPQEGNLEQHLDAFRTVLTQSIPDAEFSGVGIIDFESWRPVFRQNFGVLVPYKDVSYEIERKLHWWWPTNWVQAEAKKRFEEYARKFMQATLSLAKEMRPNAIWGYYGFPYCFNMQNSNMMEKCATKVPEENDSTYWLWSESTALYPSIYSSRDLSASQLAALVRGRVKEAARLRRPGTPILPYFWFRYRDGGFMTEMDLNTVLKMLYKSYAAGFIIWGSSKDVNTVEKCDKLHDYVDNIMGPAIAKYTKTVHKTDDDIIYESLVDISNNFVTTDNVTETSNYKDNITDTTTYRPTVITTSTMNDSNKTNGNFSTTLKPLLKTIQYDPEFHWYPPENYTQDIVQYVEEEFKKYNVSLQQSSNETDFKLFRHSSLIDILLSTIIDNMLTNNSDANEQKAKQSDDENDTLKVVDNKSSTDSNDSTTEISTTEKYDIYTEFATEYEIQLTTSTDTSDYSNIETTSVNTTDEPLVGTTVNYSIYNENTFSIPDITTTKSDITTVKSITTTTKLDVTTELIPEESTSFTQTLITNESTITTETTLSVNEDKLISKSNEQNSKQIKSTQKPVELSDEDNSNIKIVDVEVKIHIPMFSKNSKKGLPRRINDDTRKTNLTSLSLTSTSSTDDQVTGSATRNIGPKYFICIILYVFSLSKYRCDIFRNYT